MSVPRAQCPFHVWMFLTANRTSRLGTGIFKPKLCSNKTLGQQWPCVAPAALVWVGCCPQLRLSWLSWLSWLGYPSYLSCYQSRAARGSLAPASQTQRQGSGKLVILPCIPRRAQQGLWNGPGKPSRAQLGEEERPGHAEGLMLPWRHRWNPQVCTQTCQVGLDLCTSCTSCTCWGVLRQHLNSSLPAWRVALLALGTALAGARAVTQHPPGSRHSWSPGQFPWGFLAFILGRCSLLQGGELRSWQGSARLWSVVGLVFPLHRRPPGVQESGIVESRNILS